MFGEAFLSFRCLDYVVPPLEGVWWMQCTHGKQIWDQKRRDDWLWTLMIRQPDFVTVSLSKQAKQLASQKKDNATIGNIRFDSFHEGLSAQIMHIGPYAEAAPTIAHLHDFVREHGYRLHGKHREIYLSDPRKTDAAKMKTVLRHPIVSA